jgi:cyclophilin family peptidyl-prolyl cis-trans isomerase
MDIRVRFFGLLSGGLVVLCLASPQAGSAAAVARVHSVLGDFDLELLDDSAPATVANFLNYVRDGDYVGMFFHRSVPGFVVQGGGFTFDETLGQPVPVPADPPIVNEFNVSNTRGTVAMARLSGQPDSATSQWFVNLVDNNALDSVDGGFSVFARVLGDGMDVVDAMAALDIFNFGGVFNEMPTINYDGVSPVAKANLVIVSSVETFPQLTPPFASVLPGSRSVAVGSAATGFASIINSGSTTAVGCALRPVTSVTADFLMQTTDPLTNALIGTPDTPVDIPGDGIQTFLFSFTPTQAFETTEIQLDFSCVNAEAAATTVGLNTFSLSASTTPVADIVALAATPTGDGISIIPGVTGTGVFSVATVNVGTAGTISVSADTGGAALPVSVAVCETNPGDGACLQAPAVLVESQMAPNGTSTFSFFVQANGSVPFDPAANRVFARFRDATGGVRGSTSVAVRTQ